MRARTSIIRKQHRVKRNFSSFAIVSDMRGKCIREAEDDELSVFFPFARLFRDTERERKAERKRERERGKLREKNIFAHKLTKTNCPVLLNPVPFFIKIKKKFIRTLGGAMELLAKDKCLYWNLMQNSRWDRESFSFASAAATKSTDLNVDVIMWRWTFLCSGISKLCATSGKCQKCGMFFMASCYWEFFLNSMGNLLRQRKVLSPPGEIRWRRKKCWENVGKIFKVEIELFFSLADSFPGETTSPWTFSFTFILTFCYINNDFLFIFPKPHNKYKLPLDLTG